MMREFYRMASKFQEFMNQCKAWFVSWIICDRLIILSSHENIKISLRLGAQEDRFEVNFLFHIHNM